MYKKDKEYMEYDNCALIIVIMSSIFVLFFGVFCAFLKDAGLSFFNCEMREYHVIFIGVFTLFISITSFLVYRHSFYPRRNVKWIKF